MNLGKFIGSMLILIGTAIGAGMLALPLISANAGFTLATLLMLFVWALMTITGLLVLEVNLALDASACSFSSMAGKTIGTWGKIIAWLACLLLLYSLTSAYMAGAASLLSNLCNTYTNFKIPNFVNALLFTLVFGGAVYWSTKVTDYTNRFLISTKGLLLFITLALLLPHLNTPNLIQLPTATSWKFLSTTAPIFLCAFGYHTVIPSLRIYIGDKPKELRLIIIGGTLVALIIYLFWLAATLGVVPLVGENSFATLTKNNGSVGDMVKIITLIVNNKWIAIGVNGFSNIAMTTSFLGVTLGLFDFLADGCKRPDTRFGRTQTALLTFIPPLIFAFFFPKGFVLALGYAAIFVTILEIILPALMAWKLRKNNQLHSSYRVFGGKPLLYLVIIVGALLIILQLATSLHLVA